MSSYWLNKVLYRIKRDRQYRALFLNQFEKSLEGFALSQDEVKALRERNYEKLFDLGAKSMLLLPFAGIAKPGDMFTLQQKERK
jgi:Aromatic-ring-opening dioxygenase LigAB, LigA subunit